MHYKKLMIGLLLSGCCLFAQSQTVELVVRNYIAFTGGEKKWKAVRSIVTKGLYNYGGISFPFTTYAKAPNLYRFIVPLNGKYFEQAYDGETGWKIDAFKGETKKTVITGKDARALINEADVELESPFINYKNKGHTVTLEGLDTAGKTVRYKVKLVKKDGAQETYFFNAKTYALVEKLSASKNAELDGSMLQTYYSDYRLVQGIKIPFKAVSKNDNQTVLTITVRKATINALIADKMFKL